MKKILSTLCMALVGVAMMAQQPVITFEKTEHDFGKIAEDGGRVSVEFKFKNEGMAPLVLSNVRASCGCTTPTWTKEPVEPGKVGSITVTYNPNGRPGRFQKTVTITSNASEPTAKVYIKGEVIPKQAKPVNKFPVAVGELNMKSLTLDFGSIKKGDSRTAELEYTNPNAEEHSVELATSGADAFLLSQVSLPAIKQNEVGQFQFRIESKDPKLYGPVEAYAYVVIDGKRVLDDAHKLTIKANIEEDFSAMTVEEKQQAPILEIQNEFPAVTIAAGKSQKYVFPIKNLGVNPLEIRRAYCLDKNMGVKAPKPIKSGKRGAVTVDINTQGLEKGAYVRELVIISNDYVNPIKRVRFNFIVE